MIHTCVDFTSHKMGCFPIKVTRVGREIPRLSASGSSLIGKWLKQSKIYQGWGEFKVKW
jgi:hypothetical protein